MAMSKYNIVLIDIGYEGKPDKEMGVREIESWSEVEKLANHWVSTHGYSTWKLGPIDEKVITKRKPRTTKSKKS